MMHLPADHPVPTPRGKWLIRTLRRWGPAVLIFAGLGLIFGPALYQRLLLLADPLMLVPDARQHLYAYLRFRDPGTFPADYAGDYYLAAAPIGFRLLLTLVARVLDPTWFGQLLSVVLMVPLLGGLWIAAKRLGGYGAVFGTLAMALSCPLYIERLAGGLPRAFSYPIMALAIAALVTGRLRLLCLLVWLGMAFCPTAAVPIGLAAALVLLLYPLRDREEAQTWSFRRRAGWLAITGLLCVVTMVPSSLSIRKYGRLLRPADTAAYPEIAPGGRYGENDRAPFPPFPKAVYTHSLYALKGHKEPWCPAINRWFEQSRGPRGVAPAVILLRALLALTLVGATLLCWRDPAARRLGALALAAFISYQLACLVAPYLYMPARYASYPFPLLMMTFLPAGGGALLHELAARLGWKDPRNRVRAAGALAISLLCLVPFGGRSVGRFGLLNARSEAGLHRFLQGLPQDAVIAGWPGEPVDNIPLLSHRQAYLTYECHQAFHQVYADEMRHRMRALTAAYFASETSPLRSLRDQEHVTHLLIDLRHFQQQPEYFKPFDQEVQRAWSNGRAHGFLLTQLDNRAIIWREGTLVLLDLRQL